MDDKNILINTGEIKGDPECHPGPHAHPHHHRCHPDNHGWHPHHHGRHHRRHMMACGMVMFLIILSVGFFGSLGFHQKNALMHHNAIVNSSIMINIIVNGKNKTNEFDSIWDYIPLITVDNDGQDTQQRVWNVDPQFSRNKYNWDTTTDAPTEAPTITEV
ncbi:CLUMA_CG017286, isoform A [Clunio marinus]|uniref:CLUMA_CG017286, isoform A n=1 Tax=Clunio marinus TaxID=568069 RepID=A0A1J1IWV3_9DIPT|nr:CLUMA_CG017286, isoform A [Clunio marinus]